ncbi:hypothetical protein FOA52_003912 [Chlamydomonas sp. UWO 241]|nr:hypothetical protein FOA52_003912 [Chlamydomonas sp. UWO 241]
MRAALTELCEPPANTNHTLRYGPLPGIWAAAEKDLNLAFRRWWAPEAVGVAPEAVWITPKETPEAIVGAPQAAPQAVGAPEAPPDPRK